MKKREDKKERRRRLHSTGEVNEGEEGHKTEAQEAKQTITKGAKAEKTPKPQSTPLQREVRGQAEWASPLKKKRNTAAQTAQPAALRLLKKNSYQQ